MPIEWLQVLAHPTTKDKAGLLQKLNYEFTISDVHDLMEYHAYENYQSFEEYKKATMENQSR